MEVRPKKVRTDSAYVANRVTLHLPKWRSASWTARGKQIRHADAWQSLDKLLSQRPPDSFKISKVKGHASADDDVSGRVQGLDKYGNDQADALTMAGAVSKCISAEGTRKHQTIVVTTAMHRMMVEILAARANASKKETEHGAISVSSCTEGSEDISCDDCNGSSGTSSTATESNTDAEAAASNRRSSRRSRGRSAPAAAE